MKIKRLIGFYIIFFSAMAHCAVESRESFSGISEKGKSIRSEKKIGIALYGSSSVGTNIVEYNFLPQFSLGVGLGFKEGYDPTTFDKIKISSRYYFLRSSFSPCGVVGFVFQDYLSKFNSLSFPYFGLGTQYLVSNGLGVSFEVDYFKRNAQDNIKPGVAVLWFF